MHMQAKGTTDYKSGFTFAFEQLLNVRINKLFREGQCKGGGFFEADELSAPTECLQPCWNCVIMAPAHQAHSPIKLIKLN